MKSLLRNFYLRRQFFPGVLGLFFNPFYYARLGLANAIRRHAPALRGRLLDVGCGTKPYRELFAADTYVGLDVHTAASQARGTADVLYDGTTFPFGDSSFDGVVCNQVLEHVFNPGGFLSELHRVLRPDGKLLLTVPFVWDEHEQPYDYARYSSFGLRSLLEANGFAVREQEKLGADAGTLFQLLNGYLYKVTLPLPGWAQLFLTGTLMAVVNVLAVVAARLLPKNADLYLDQLVLAEKRA
ncbi:class I SAM-dependent methyltransferase [Ramlibacter sp.]|uniref:class I SAM-dependent methyltransferase n=1 Tax=Ramlibacter sp. TaxID=1917967 RepID=UPI002BD45031|nr:class I SAM-dependent methyltransferase [Ramlibacter sp.]HWI83124.1 class I SAM-dependent methyltransferase [Ramlibacter sp.]